MSDLISRQAATSIPVLPKEHRKCFKDMDDAFETGWNKALSCVNMLPSADRPTGEWVDYGDCEDICSVCGYSKVHEPNYPYCPNCGARMMRGEK